MVRRASLHLAYPLIALSVAVILTAFGLTALNLDPFHRELYDVGLWLGLIGGGVYAGSRVDTPLLPVGLVAAGVGLAGVGIISGNDALRLALRLYAAYGLASLGVLYALMPRFSHVSDGWYRLSLRVTAVLMGIATLLLTLPASPISPPVIAAALVIIASHSYKAFSSRNDSLLLAAHWSALAVILWVGVGLLGAVMRFPAFAPYITGTSVESALAWWMRGAALALVLGMGNQVTAERRGANLRITGLSAYWLIAFGTICGGIVLLCAGAVEVYLVHLFDLDPARALDLLSPFVSLRWLTDAALLVGMIIYAAQFWLRRPRTIR